MKSIKLSYSTSSELMQAIHALDEKGQVAVLDAFVDFYSKFPTSSSPHLCDRFGDDYGTYREFRDGDYSNMFLKRSILSMQIIIEEMDYVDPMTFFKLADKLAKVIKKESKRGK